MRLVALALVVVAVGTAHAQPSRVKETGFIGKDVLVLEIDDCRPMPPMDDDAKRRLGSEHYQRGEVLFAQGDYPGAADELIAAYCIFPFPTILKDIGETYQRQLEYAKALAYFERYVRDVPPDAKRAGACDLDPQVDKANVLARISVLAKLPARIRVNTEPADALVTLSNAAGVAKNREKTGRQLEVPGGTYEMTIERAGFHTHTETITAEIGQPYTYFVRLEPLEGRVHVRVVPVDAKLYLDKKPMGQGAFDAELPGGHYQLYAEAPDHVQVTRDIEVLPDRDSQIAFELKPQPEYGRKQLLGYGTVAAGAAGALLVAAQKNTPFYNALGVVGGVAGGFLGIYYGTPNDLALGPSSLTITGSLAGGVLGGALAATITNQYDSSTLSPGIGAGLVLGAGAAYYIGSQTHLSAGDAAIINSGALWGTVSSSLLSLSFNASPQISGSIVLSGLGVGTIGGVLLQRYFTISRGHAALIDASGLVGVVGGLATLSVFARANGLGVQNDERTSNFALGGLAAGLIIGGVVTRNLDEPHLVVSPVMGRVSAVGGPTTTLGFGAQF
ncbi:MAG TPA: PEGA domain-containing protein [Kofleriaceae bacterium]|nr:PEGA domain-containing protein [Kofleriaceae bacterium]